MTSYSDTTADVRFELDAAGPATVEIGPEHSPNPARKIVDGGASAMHVLHVTGLEPGKTYAYGITVGGPIVGRGEVTTAPKLDAGAPIHFLIYGDNRSDPSAHAAITRAMGETPSDFLLNTGDIVEDGGSASDWQTFFQVEAPLLRERPIFLCIGNHELYDDEAGANFARYFGFPDASGSFANPKPYGTARVGMVRLFFLNAMHDWDSGEERDWLERELRKSDGELGLAWRIAAVHHGPWSSGPHGPNPRLVSAHLPELLAAHKVDLIVSGHDHIYERGDSGATKYLISGGGGAPLYRITHPSATTRKAEAAYHFIEVTATSGDLRIVARRLDGSVLDKCGFAKNQGWDCDTPPMPVAAPPAAPPSAPAASATAPHPPAASSRCALAVPGEATDVGSWVAVCVVAGAAALGRRRRG